MDGDSGMVQGVEMRGDRIQGSFSLSPFSFPFPPPPSLPFSLLSPPSPPFSLPTPLPPFPPPPLPLFLSPSFFSLLSHLFLLSLFSHPSVSPVFQ